MIVIECPLYCSVVLAFTVAVVININTHKLGFSSRDPEKTPTWL